jgi:hypothetical protein
MVCLIAFKEGGPFESLIIRGYLRHWEEGGKLCVFSDDMCTTKVDMCHVEGIRVFLP